MFRLRPSGLLVLAVCVVPLSACPGGSVNYEPAFVSASTDLVDFGDVEVGTTNRQTVTLVNKGDVAALLDGDPEGDTFGGAFSFLVGSFEILPQDDLGAPLVFAPTQAGTYETVVTFRNDSINAPEIQVTVKGRAVQDGDCQRDDECQRAPTPLCINSATSRLYLPFGRCVEKRCVHESEEETCNPSWGCNFETGRCKTDPCIGVSCQTPPSPCFLGNGTCVNGACNYPVNNGAVCSDGNGCTDSDRCLEGTCVGAPKVCELPPAQAAGYCENIGTAQAPQWRVVGQRDPTGTCMEVSESAGRCEYDDLTINCPVGCESGRCKADSCVGFNANDPNNACNDNNPCTIDGCERGDCTHVDDDGAPCDLNAECSVGACNRGRCRPAPGAACTAEIDLDLCNDVEVAGVCDSIGQCTPSQTGNSEFSCPECPNGLCIQCFSIRFCIPFN